MASLRLLLHAQGVRVIDLAKAIGEERNTVQNWLDRGIPPAKMFSVADALGMTPDELRPYLSAGGLDAQQLLAMEVDAFLERLPKLPKEQRLYVLERLFNVPLDDDDTP